MSIRPITNTYNTNRPNFKGTVDDSVKTQVFNELKNYFKSETFVASNKKESVDTAQLKTMSEISRNAIRKLNAFMKKCHPDTKLIYDKKNCTNNRFRIINKKMTDNILPFQKNYGIYISRPVPIYESGIDIEEPNMNAYGTGSSIKDFSNFVEKLTSELTPQDIDKALLEKGKKELLSLIKKPTFIRTIKAKQKAKKLEKLANELDFPKFAQDIKETITQFLLDKKAGTLDSQIQAKLKADNKKVVQEILDNSNIIN